MIVSALVHPSAHALAQPTASQYVGLDARASAERYVRKRAVIVTLVIVISIMLLVISLAWAGPHFEHPEALLVFFVLYAITLGAEMVLINRTYTDLLGIMATDFNAQKMLEVLSLLLQKYRNRRRFSRTLQIQYALCSQQLGYDDIAIQWVEQAETFPNMTAANRLLACNVRLNVATEREDWGEAAAVRGRITALLAGLSSRSATRRLATLILAWADFRLALHDGDWQRCSEAIGSMTETASTPLQKLCTEYSRGLLAEARGDLITARDRYQFVAGHRGDVSVIRGSARRLSELQ